MTTVEDGIIKPVKALQELSVIKADELDAMHLEPPKFVVDKLFPQGLGIIVGCFEAVLCGFPKHDNQSYALNFNYCVKEICETRMPL